MSTGVTSIRISGIKVTKNNLRQRGNYLLQSNELTMTLPRNTVANPNQ